MLSSYVVHCRICSFCPAETVAHGLWAKSLASVKALKVLSLALNHMDLTASLAVFVDSYLYFVIIHFVKCTQLCTGYYFQKSNKPSMIVSQIHLVRSHQP